MSRKHIVINDTNIESNAEIENPNESIVITFKEFEVFIQSIQTFHIIYNFVFGGDNPDTQIINKYTQEQRENFIKTTTEAVKKDLYTFKKNWEQLTIESKEQVISLINKKSLFRDIF